MKKVIIFLIALGIGISSIHAQLLVTARVTERVEKNTAFPNLWEQGYTYYTWGKTHDDGNGGYLTQPRDIMVFVKIPHDPGMNDPMAQSINMEIGEPGQGFFKKAYEGRGLYPPPTPYYDESGVQVGWTQNTNILLVDLARFKKEYKAGN